MTTGNSPRERLEYLRSQLRAECISYGELGELQDLAEHIEPGDVELLEAAGVPEFADSFIELTFEVTIEQHVDNDDDPDKPSPTEQDVQAGLHRALDGEFDLGAITVVRQ